MKRRATGSPIATMVAMLAILATGCAPEHEAKQEAGTADASGPASMQATEGSLFELHFPLTDATGRERRLAEFAGGGPIVASMVYTSCKSVCPRITADLRTLDGALPADLRARTRFLLFSLDPGRDTPAALAAFAREHQLDDRWTLLAAAEDDMRTLAAVLGVRFRPDAGGEIAHSAVIAVADGDGVLRHRQMGLGTDPAPLVGAVRSASRTPTTTQPARR